MFSHLAPGPSALAVRSAVRRPSRRSGGFAALFTLALGLVLPAGLARAQGLNLSGFSPAVAAPAEPVTLFGSGFAADPAEHFAFVLGPAGQGVLLEPVSTLPGELEVRLGPAATTFDGAVHLWRGQRHLLPVALIGGEEGAWKVHLAEFFVPTEATVASKPLQVDATTLLAGSAALETGGIEVEVEPEGEPRRPIWIDLGVTIDGGSCGSAIGSGGGTPPLQKETRQKGPALPCRAVHLRVENIDRVESSEPGALARDLALILRSTFGPVGLVATAEGPWVRISWSRISTVPNGFAVLRFEY